MEESCHLEGLKILSADSTAVNTGPKNGALHLIEEGLGRKAQWNICKLHINELGLRHLIADIDGPTNSENTFSGPIGKLIKTNVEDIKINQKFKKIITGEDIFDLPNEVVDDLSTDQKYGYMMVKMIRSGVIDKSLTKLKCGPICHGRWLTTANRIMRLYVSKHGLKGQVLKNLALITEFIVTQYYFMWFEIK